MTGKVPLSQPFAATKLPQAVASRVNTDSLQKAIKHFVPSHIKLTSNSFTWHFQRWTEFTNIAMNSKVLICSVNKLSVEKCEDCHGEYLIEAKEKYYPLSVEKEKYVFHKGM